MENYFYKNLKFLRKSRNLSQQVIADKIGVDRSTIGYWESKKADPTMQNVVKLAEVFRIELVDFICKDLESGISNVQIYEEDQDEKYKKILRDKGLMDNEDNIATEDFEKLIDFAIANKEFLINKKKKD